MTSVADFIRIPKRDAHNHLEYGMRYQSYVPWAGYYIPDFPVEQPQSEEQTRAAIEPYTRARIRTEKDVIDTLNLSLLDAVGDGVTSVDGTIDVSLIQNCQSVEHFTDLIKKVIAKYQNRVELHPVLGIHSELALRTFQKSMLQLLRTGVFTGIDLYGPVPGQAAPFTSLFKVAGNFGMRRKVHTECCTTSDQLRQIIELLHPDELVQGIGIADDDELLRRVAAGHIKVSVCPRALVQTGAYPDYQSIPLRRLTDAQVQVQLSTCSLLLFHKSISEQCVELCNAGMYTKEELTALISSTPSAT